MNASYAAYFTPATQANMPFLQLPTLALLQRCRLHAGPDQGALSYTPFEELALQLQADWWSRDYQGPNCGGPNDQLLLPSVVLPAQCQGQTKATGQTRTLDGQYVFAHDWRFNAFYTWARITQDQAGRAFASVATGTAIGFAGDPTRNWAVDSKTTDNTVWAGPEVDTLGAAYDPGLQYLYNQGRTAIDTFAGAALAPPGALPDVMRG